MLVTLIEPVSRRDLTARTAAIRRYREGAAALRAIAQTIEAGCRERPCAEATGFRRLARHAETAAWLEEHDPGRSRR